jgi:hypothetical protein
MAVLNAENVAEGGPLEWWSVLGGWNVVTCQASGSIDMNVGTLSKYICTWLVCTRMGHEVENAYLAIARLRNRLAGNFHIHRQHFTRLKLLCLLVLIQTIGPTFVIP